jgi:hypothetical protein
MLSQAWVMLGILAVMFSLLIWGKLPAWLVFMGTRCSLNRKARPRRIASSPPAGGSPR